MIHMLSAFEMKPGEDEAAFGRAYAAFVEDLRAEKLIADAGPIGARLADTPMDTDAARRHTHFSVLSFHDRRQLNHAYAWLTHRKGGSSGSHNDMHARITNSVFLCWQDISATEEKEP